MASYNIKSVYSSGMPLVNFFCGWAKYRVGADSSYRRISHGQGRRPHHPHPFCQHRTKFRESAAVQVRRKTVDVPLVTGQYGSRRLVWGNVSEPKLDALRQCDDFVYRERIVFAPFLKEDRLFILPFFFRFGVRSSGSFTIWASESSKEAFKAESRALFRSQGFQI